jgi:hypothetical protein
LITFALKKVLFMRNYRGACLLCVLLLLGCGDRKTNPEAEQTPIPYPPSMNAVKTISEVVMQAPWVYGTTKGKSRVENVYSASIASTNGLSFGWPFNSGKLALLTLKWSKGSSEVQVAFPEVTFSKRYSIVATFDSLPDHAYSGDPGGYGVLGSDAYNSQLSIESSSDFIADVRKAHHVTIKLPETSQGIQMEFDIGGLKWK